MRTTITLDDDVAVLLEEERRKQRASFKQIVNQALRAGLTKQPKPKATKRSWTTPVDHGGFLIDVTDVSEALETAEGPWHT
jgi:predicted transcriptional regulator